MMMMMMIMMMVMVMMMMMYLLMQKTDYRWLVTFLKALGNRGLRDTRALLARFCCSGLDESVNISTARYQPSLVSL